MSLIVPDVAEFQKVLDDSFSRDVISFRVSFGTGYQDKHFLANAAKAKELYEAGKIAGAILYVVPIFAQGGAQKHFSYAKSLIGPTCPDWVIAVMVDVESWGGASYEQHGDHSAHVRELATLCGKYTGGKALIYGNRSDLAELCPHRGVHPVIVAAYESDIVVGQVPHAIGQQYTDGQAKWGLPHGLPLASPPFGNCDHNVFPSFNNGHALRTYLRPNHPAPKPKPRPKPAPKHRWFYFRGFWGRWRKAHPNTPNPFKKG